MLKIRQQPHRGAALLRFAGVLLTSILLICALSVPSFGTVTFTGTSSQKDDVEDWLTRSLGTDVTIAANGDLTVAAGGNAAATRLRNQDADGAVAVTIELVEGRGDVLFGAWNSQDPADPIGKTTGTQTVDVQDLESIGNVKNSYGITPDFWLVHEITEVYEGQKHHGDCWAYHRAHAKGIEAENELIAAHSGSIVGRRTTVDAAGRYLMKIKRPDGSWVIMRIDPNGDEDDLVEWFKEKEPCVTARGLIAISDPDPQVHLMDYDLNEAHVITDTWDTVNSAPTGVAFGPSGNLYVTEDLAGTDELRVFNSAGTEIDSVQHVQLVDPQGVDVDQITGDVFIAGAGQVLRFSSSLTFRGVYTNGVVGFDPTDVAVWRNNATGIEGVFGADDIYAIYVTDRDSNEVYSFDVEVDMDQDTYDFSFGSTELSAPEGLTIGSHQAVWVASTGNDRIYRYSPTNGALITEDGAAYFVEDVSRNFFDLVMVDGDGIYVVDETPSSGEIVLYGLDGAVKDTYGAGELQCPSSIAAKFEVDDANLVHFDPSITDVPTLSLEGLLIALVAISVAAFIALLRRRSRVRT